MVPETTICAQCGRTVLVLSWSPVYDNAADLTSESGETELAFTCKIECPECGTLIQSVQPAA